MLRSLIFIIALISQACHAEEGSLDRFTLNKQQSDGCQNLEFEKPNDIGRVYWRFIEDESQGVVYKKKKALFLLGESAPKLGVNNKNNYAALLNCLTQRSFEQFGLEIISVVTNIFPADMACRQLRYYHHRAKHGLESKSPSLPNSALSDKKDLLDFLVDSGVLNEWLSVLKSKRMVLTPNSGRRLERMEMYSITGYFENTYFQEDRDNCGINLNELTQFDPHLADANIFTSLGKIEFYSENLVK